MGRIVWRGCWLLGIRVGIEGGQNLSLRGSESAQRWAKSLSVSVLSERVRGGNRERRADEMR